MTQLITTQVCIVGAGPAGAMLAMLLAREGIHVTLIEKSIHHEREFRGESISPDSVALLDKLNIMPYIEKHGYIKTEAMQIIENHQCLVNINFSQFEYPYKYTIDIPQPVLISALLAEARKHPNFIFLPGTKCNSLITNHEIVEGIICSRDEEIVHIKSQLVVGADGRYGKIRKFANLEATVSPLARDVLWFMVTKPCEWGDIAKLCIHKNNHIIILPTYPNWLRIGFNIPSGEYKKIRQQPIDYLHKMIDQLAPKLVNTVKQEITAWSHTSLLDIFTMEVEKWDRTGLILIGDASHTFSPILGQGVNQALMDAYKLAPILKNYFISNSNLVCSSSLFEKYIYLRKQEKNLIHNFQIKQEKILMFASPLKTFARRLSYRLINRSRTLQNKLWGQVLYKYQKQYSRL